MISRIPQLSMVETKYMSLFFIVAQGFETNLTSTVRFLFAFSSMNPVHTVLFNGFLSRRCPFFFASVFSSVFPIAMRKKSYQRCATCNLKHGHYHYFNDRHGAITNLPGLQVYK